jgi:AcrR family transcriptional regulator
MTDEAATVYRTPNPRGQGARLRLEILHAASRLVSELGGEQGLTIRGVARAAGIAPASIYQHFADKAELVEGLARYNTDRLALAVRDAGLGLAADPVAALHAQLHAYCHFALDNPGHYRLLLTSRSDARGPRQSLTPILEVVAETLGRCEAAGHQLRMPVERAAVMVFVGIHGRVALFHSDSTDQDTTRVLAFADELTALVFTVGG